MLTTQIQLLLYVGNIQVVSCSVFVPVPAIVVKSHQTLEALLPFLPLSLTAASDPQALLPLSDSDPHPHPHSTSLVLSSRPTPESHHSHSHIHTATTTTTTARRHRDSSSAQISPNRISPDSSIPAATCIQISLQPTPTFKLVKPKCPHLHQRNRNRRHHHQQQQQQQQHPLNSHTHPSHSSHPSHSCHTSSHTHARAQHRHTHNDSMTSHAHSSSSTLSGSNTIPVKFSFPTSFNASTPAKVQITGTFNAWQRTEPLVRNQDGTRFEGEVSIHLEKIQDLQDKGQQQQQQQQQQQDTGRSKILFKFVLDDNQWVTDPDQAIERDYAGNLNNVLFLDYAPRTTVADTTSVTPATATATAAVPSPAEIGESEEERIARLKQEEEDDATIRQLGGGMWGTPFFAVNDPADLPEHFKDNSESCVSVVEDVAIADVSNEEVTLDKQHRHQDTEAATPHAAAEAIEIVPEVTQENQIAPEKKKKEEQEQEEEDEDDKIIRALGGGMWGTPFFAVNDPADLPEHFTNNPESSVSTAEEVEVAVVPNEVVADKQHQEAEAEIPSAVSKTIEAVPEVSQEKQTAPEKKEEQEDEDEDDKIIRALGGGMWGTPFFQVNDPAVLPEHFVEAVSASHPGAVATVDTIKEEDEDEDEVQSTIVHARDISTPQDVHKGEVLRDQIFDTVEGTLTETVVETTEDTVIEAADGSVLEETITTNIEDTISGQLDESVIEVIETVDDIEPALEQKVPSSPSSAPIITMSETETIKVTHGEDGVDTTVLEETITFTDGPEVDSSSLHSLTTGIKPVQSGESILVEQLPAVVVVVSPSDGGTAIVGDASPAMDESVDIVPSLTHSQTTSTVSSSSISSQPATVNTGKGNVHGDDHDGDGDYGEVVLQSKPAHRLSDSAMAIMGDARPTADLSAATLATLPTTLADASETPKKTTTTTGASTTDKKTEKLEKHKSIWKKIKKVLA